jgi:stage V sporulation protein AC
MNMSNRQYNDYVMSKSPKSPIWKDILLAFLIGGTICTIGQVINNIIKNYFIPDTQQASSMTSVCMIFLGAFLTAIRIYDNIAKYGGAGSLVPITGFANAMVSPSMEFKSESIITGMAAKMFNVAGPVIVFGTTTSIIYGIIYYFFLR